MNSTAAVISEPLPGYIVTERIGSGGYGEVFKATAPGGIDKAVKSLYGYHDEELASRELRALERIKQLRHPFLLSLDRFEVVNGRLIVVTELADGSLDDCFQEHRREGRPGIPRDELLSYLRDAADALDYMHQKHGLQHLDVKPENLLVVGGHVKVADFGLVKDVAHASQQSIMGGMTPTYAAPELFDNSPGARSDQYSLAIVYQELLTGTLPFPGRTAAQLVAQHTQAAPRVASLPKHDQPPIERALAKDPRDRFPSCMALVEALAAANDAARASSRQAESQQWNAPSASSNDTKGAASHATQPLPGKTPHRAGRSNDGPPPHDSSAGEAGLASAERRRAATEQISPASAAWRNACQGDSGPAPNRRAEPEVAELKVSSRVVDAPGPDSDGFRPAVRPTLLIGVGGQASGVLQRVRKNLAACDQDVQWEQLAPMLLLDTDRSAMRDLELAPVAGIKTRLMPLRLPQHYRNRSSDILQWLSRRWFYNIPRSLETGGFRPLGRLAMIDNAESVMDCIGRQLKQLVNQDELASLRLPPNIECRADKPRVIIVASTSGGTGSGTALDLAWAIRNTLASQDENGMRRAEVELTGIFGDCSGAASDERDLALVNTLAFLREFSSIAREGNRSRDAWHEQTAMFEGPRAPLDRAYFVSANRGERQLSVEQWIDETAEYLTADIASGCGPWLDACRTAARLAQDDAEAADKVHSFVVSPLDEQREVVTRLARENLCRMVIRQWRRHKSPAADQGQRAQRWSDFMPTRLRGRKERARKKAARDEALARLSAAIREQFGDASESFFAKQLAAVLAKNLESIAANGKQDDGSAAADPIRKLVQYAFEELTKAVCHFSADAGDGEAMSARCLKTAQPSDEPLDQDPPGNEQAAVAEKVALQACTNYFAALAVGGKPWILDLGKSLEQAVDKTFEECSGTIEGKRVLGQLADCKPDLELLVGSAVVGPPGCGHERRTLALIPEEADAHGLEAEVKALLPTATIVRGSVARPLLIREARGLSLAQAAAKLCADRPDLVEASRRLQARNDVAWLPLPRVVEADPADRAR